MPGATKAQRAMAREPRRASSLSQNTPCSCPNVALCSAWRVSKNSTKLKALDAWEAQGGVWLKHDHVKDGHRTLSTPLLVT